MHHMSSAAEKLSSSPCNGVTVTMLAENRNGGLQALVRMEPGSVMASHTHPGCEKFYLLRGSIRINGQDLGPGDYMNVEAGAAHKVQAVTRSLFMSISECGGVDFPPAHIQHHSSQPELRTV